MRIVVPLGLVWVLTGCLSFSSYQTADTLKPMKASFFAAAGYQTVEVATKVRDPNDDTVLVDSTTELKVPIIEYGLRFGLMKDFDVGLRSGLFGSYTLDGKYRLMQSRNTSLATGLAIGYANYSVGASSSESAVETSLSLIDVSLPLYWSYHVSENFAFYAAPRVMMRQSKVTSNDENFESETKTQTAPVYGGSVGIVVGSNVAGIFEYSYFTSDEAAGTAGVSQVMLGMAFGLHNQDREWGEEEPQARPRKRRRRKR